MPPFARHRPARRPSRPSPSSSAARALSVALVVVLAAAGCQVAGAGSRPGVPAALAAASPDVSALPSPASPAPASLPPASLPPATPPPGPSPTPTPQPGGAAGPPAPAPVRPTASADLGRTLQRALDAVRKEHGVPGVSATIVFPDGSTWTGVSGHADVAAQTPVTPRTAFSAASISKTFLAALVLDLAAEGRFDLDDSASRHLPDVKLDARISIRHLLDHTSGLHDYFLHPKIDVALQSARGSAWSAARTLEYVGKPYFAPGRGWRYSNTNYLLLGLLAERVTGRTLAAEFRARFFTPLRLDTAFYQTVEPARGPVAHGYRVSGAVRTPTVLDLSDGSGVVPFTSVVTAAAGAGSVAASSADIARWAWALYGGTAIDPASVALMLADIDRVAVLRPRVPYGLGVQALAVDGFRTLGHSGRFLGSRGTMRYLADENVAIAVLTNESRTDPSLFARRLLGLALPPAPPPPPAGPTEASG